MLLTGNAAEAVKQSARWPDCMTYHMDNLCFTETSTQHVPTEMKPNAMTVFCRVHSCWHIIGWANSGVTVNQTVTETSVKSFFVHLSHHKDDQWRPYKLWFTLISVCHQYRLSKALKGNTSISLTLTSLLMWGQVDEKIEADFFLLQCDKRRYDDLLIQLQVKNKCTRSILVIGINKFEYWQI